MSIRTGTAPSNTGPTAAVDWSLWSTTARLVVAEPGYLAAARVLVDAELAAVGLAASRFRADSEVMTLVRDDDGVAPVSTLLADLLEAALTAARETDGALDPTVANTLVDLGYDRDISLLERGDRPAVRTGVRPVPGWRSLRLDRGDGGDRLVLPAGVALDLGATAKAVAADRCAALVADRLGTGVLVSLGGDIATAGAAPEGGWQVLVQDVPEDPAARVSLTPGAALATSSTVRRTWTQDGAVRHHLLDPATGRPARSPWRSVSVVAPTCLEANTASSATVVKGADGADWVRGTGWPSRLVGHDGSVLRAGGWPEESAA